MSALLGDVARLAVGLLAALVLGVFAGLQLAALLVALAFLVLGSLAMALSAFSQASGRTNSTMAAITNFLIQPLAFLSGTFIGHKLPPPFDTIAT